MVKTTLKNRWILARLEGFEPPTVRSEVRLKALLVRTAKKTRVLYLGFPEFTSIRFYLVSRVYGSIHEYNNMMVALLSHCVQSMSLRGANQRDTIIERALDSLKANIVKATATLVNRPMV
jgi:hypothetical protein